MSKSIRIIFIIMMLTALLLSACSKVDQPAAAIEAYWKAMAAKDSAALSSLSCAEYEAIAVSTLDSFITVELELTGLACTSTNNTGDKADVTCQGSLSASYGAEKFDFDLSNKIFVASNPAGDWLMCGEK
ncbi:MAG: hypothetical protein CVU42_02120 [Chloroflexi bacterium HGW-Chloroflexi-4]|jgi:hypothetical protein|nr:MAG: hypothetical protein CVU42_02120 [Chloroflexi bacterium HGW-Chloroflexi-4]